MSITVRNTKKEEFLNVVSVNEGTNEAVVDKSYFETSADQVVIDTPIDGVTGGNVAEALGNLATGVSQAGKVDDVQDVNGASIVTNKIAKLSKAAVGLGNVDNTADTEKTVKQAGKVASALRVGGTNTGGEDSYVSFDGSKGKDVIFVTGEFNTAVKGDALEVSIVDKGYVTETELTGKGYATKSYTDTELAKKLDKAGGTVTGALAVNGGVTIGGNLTVNGTTTTVDSTTLQVKDKLIEVAHGNTTKLTTPAGLVAPKYDGTNSGALVFDGDGIASVGDVVLDASGNIDVTRSHLQPLATRTGLVNDNLVKYDGTNQTLVDTGKKVGDFATAAQGATADSALAKAEAAQKDVTELRSEVEDLQDGTTKVGHATLADNATNVTTNINGNAITSIFETNGTTVKNATHATSADSATTAGTATTANKLNKALHFGYYSKSTSKSEDSFDGSAEKSLMFEDGSFSRAKVAGSSVVPAEYRIDLKDTGVAAGVYTAVQVDTKGRATAGQQAFAVIGPNDDIPRNVVIGGFVLRTKA